MADAEAKTPSLYELIADLHMTVVGVAGQMGLSRAALYTGRYRNGRLTPQEIDTIADVLRIERARVEDAVRENARRYEADRSTGGKSTDE
jgi:hypothetical protein